jgi:hypothetical protein
LLRKAQQRERARRGHGASGAPSVASRPAKTVIALPAIASGGSVRQRSASASQSVRNGATRVDQRPSTCSYSAA